MKSRPRSDISSRSLRRRHRFGTPPWQVDGWTLPESFAKVEQQWGAIRELLEDEDVWSLRVPRISGWSCGEHGAHLVMVNQWIATGIEVNLSSGVRHAYQGPSRAGRAVLESGSIPRGQVQSPPQVRPEAADRVQCLSSLSAVVDAWRALHGRRLDLDRCPARFPHFALGFLTSSDWVRFAAIHSAHHLALVRDIRAAAPEDWDARR